MSEFLSRLVGILLLRDGPQDLPAGALPLALAVAFYVAASGASLLLGSTPDRPALVMAVAVVLPLLLIRIVLGLRGHPARWQQTATALFGTGALLAALSLPLSAAGPEPAPALIVAGLVVFIWSFAVDAHIWRHALEASFAVGLAVAVVLFTVSISVITSITGSPS